MKMARPCEICAVFAHPDDEAFGVAGTLARYAAEGIGAALICATLGETGLSNGLADSPAELASLRAAELRCSAQAIGLADLALFDFPDGGGSEWDLVSLASRLREELQRIRPAVVITFDGNGITCHPDHIAVHTVTRQLVEAEGARLGIRRLFYHVVTCPEEASPEGPSLMCISPEAVDVTVDIRLFEAAKRAALGCHRTQAADTSLLLDQPQGSLTAEHYQLAWTDDGWQPSPGLGNLLVGLLEADSQWDGWHDG
jgi:LmbE family N-acetylglucosaminyl deacetylase